MKKIGIVTLYDDVNIGNKLQNYAVQSVYEKMGYQVETLRHWDMVHKPINKNEVKKYIKSIILPNSEESKIKRLQIIRKKRFRKFSDKYIKIGPILKFGKIPDGFKSKYDFFVVGSDQVWHNWLSVKDELSYFMLSFANKCQRLTISPSFGKDEIHSFVDEYREGLNGFIDLTCREKKGAEIIYELTGRRAQVTLDPTMLISADEWKKIEKKPSYKIGEDYILVYSLGGLDLSINQYVEEIAEEKHLQIIDIYNPNKRDLYMTTPDEFIYLVSHSRLVITDSFHACAFSILYNKDFIVFNRNSIYEGNMMSRVSTLLETFEIENRVYYQGYNYIPVDYFSIEKKLRNEREKTIRILKESIEKLEALSSN
ncbi:MAG: polysaccharide pyruvyl transferase family protein [Blautia sp.]|nr:polysaccharide pyruvyl transferase family protein [Blautia sp.]